MANSSNQESVDKGLEGIWDAQAILGLMANVIAEADEDSEPISANLARTVPMLSEALNRAMEVLTSIDCNAAGLNEIVSEEVANA